MVGMASTKLVDVAKDAIFEFGAVMDSLESIINTTEYLVEVLLV